MLQIKLNNKYIRKGSPYFNQDLKDWSIELLELGYKRDNIGNILTSELGYLELSDFLTIMSLDDGHVEGYTPVFKIPTSGMTEIIPEGLPNRMKPAQYSGDTENLVLITPETPKTWNEWIMDNHFPTVLDGYTYFPSNWGNAPKAAPLKDSEIMIIYQYNPLYLVDGMPIIEDSAGVE